MDVCLKVRRLGTSQERFLLFLLRIPAGRH